MTCGPFTLEAGWENYADNVTASADPSNFTVRVYAGAPDALSANVELYWDYVQGANKCTQFALTISDGTATYVYRVRAVSTAGTQKHRVDIKSLSIAKAVTISIAAEFIASSGVTTRAAVSGWSFTPSGSSGSSPAATLVGTLDWAHGSVWYETDQYRNNLAPTNPPSAGMSMLLTATPGANQGIISLSNLAYSQGANIATHIAVLLRYGGGSISLTSDAIVTLLNLSSLPASYTIPYPVKNTDDFTAGIAACALTKNGYSFNSTVRQYSVSGEAETQISSDSDTRIGAADGHQVLITHELSLVEVNLVMSAGQTVDGVDVSALNTTVSNHTAATAAHGTTGAILGANMTNTLGASGIIDAKTNDAKICVKFGPNFADAAHPPTLTAGQSVPCYCTGNSKYYWVHFDGTNYFYAYMGANSLT